MREFGPHDTNPAEKATGFASLEAILTASEKILTGFDKLTESEAVTLTAHGDFYGDRQPSVEAAWGDKIADTTRYNVRFGHLADAGCIRKLAYACTITSPAEGPGLFYQRDILLDTCDLDELGKPYARKDEIIYHLNDDGSRSVIQSRRTFGVTEEELGDMIAVLHEV